jgi:hypothetical protein
MNTKRIRIVFHKNITDISDKAVGWDASVILCAFFWLGMNPVLKMQRDMTHVT